MEKVNCDFCGSAFPVVEEKCPICGWARNRNEKRTNSDSSWEDEFDFLNEEEYSERKNKSVFDYDKVNANDEDEPAMEDGEEEPDSNAVLVVILVVIIALLLIATGFVFFRYFLPNITDKEETTLPATQSTIAETEESTVPTIPCRMLAMTSELPKLNREGQPWLLHITVTPENTTDDLIYISEDENVATVSEDGKIIAVGEGETIIKIICGEQIIKCPVIVDYDMVIEEVLPDSIPAMGVEEGATADATDSTQPPEQTQETKEPVQEETTPVAVVLKLKESDISLSKVRGITYELTMDCDLAADQVDWITLDSNVLLVKNGIITVMGPGTTKVVAKYNGQTVECIVRCVF